MPALVGLIPVDDVGEVTLRPTPRWTGKFLGVNGHADRKCKLLGPEEIEAFPIKSRRRCGSAGKPIEHDVVEHGVATQGALGLATVVGPGIELLVDPRG